MTVYDKLLQLPFFQGIDHDELEDIASKIRFDFQKIETGDFLAKENEKCLKLTLLMEGRIQAYSYNADHRYSICEELEAPYAIEPERLFGLQQHLARNYRAETPCSLVCLPKDDVLRLCGQCLVFELNYLNAISTTAQRVGSIVWKKSPTTITRKIANFVAHRCLRPAGLKTLNIRMADLAKAIGESRLNVSHTLKDLQAQGLITYQREKIIIPHLEKLLSNNKH